VEIKINIPDRDYGRLVNAAEGMGMRVPQMILAAAFELMPWRSTTEQRVEHLVRAGLTDARIAERMDVPKWKVARVRQELGLKPNQIASRAA
jgi:hypothetical protein